MQGTANAGSRCMGDGIDQGQASDRGGIVVRHDGEGSPVGRGVEVVAFESGVEIGQCAADRISHATCAIGGYETPGAGGRHKDRIVQ